MPPAKASLFRRSPLVSLLLVLSLLSATVAITRHVTAEENPPAQTQPQAPVVKVTTIEAQPVQLWNTYSGRLVPVDSAAIKPLVSGTITEVLFEDGQQVEKGMRLFTIDPRPHLNALTSAEARLATAHAQLQLARDEYGRFERLNAQDMYPDNDLDHARARLRMAEASKMEAESAVEQARLNVEYAHITSPISGRAGRAELTVGNVVEAGPNAPVLTTVVAASTLYAEFDVDEKSYLNLAGQAAGDRNLPVEVSPGEGTATPYSGYLHAFDNHLDVRSGTIRARALVNNSDGVLTPGLFVSVRLGSSQPDPVLLVPTKALGTNQDRRFVYVVDDNDTVAYREVTLGETWQDQRVVLSGLEAGNRVITEGLARVAPGMPVSAIPDDSENVAAR